MRGGGGGGHFLAGSSVHYCAHEMDVIAGDFRFLFVIIRPYIIRNLIFGFGLMHGYTYMYYNKEYREGFPRECVLTLPVRRHSTAKVSANPRGTIPTVFLYCIYRSRPSMMLKYVKTCQSVSVSVSVYRKLYDFTTI